MKRLVFLFSFLLCVVIAKADVYGPYDLQGANVPQPSGYSKIIVYSHPLIITGYIVLKNVSTGEEVTLSSLSNTRVYYYIPNGTYEVIEIQDEREAANGSGSVCNYYDIGDTVTYSGSAAIIFRFAILP